MDTREALLRAGIAVMDELHNYHKQSQTMAVNSAEWHFANGAISACNKLSERLYQMLQQEALEDAGLPMPEPTGLRVITGGRRDPG